MELLNAALLSASTGRPGFMPEAAGMNMHGATGMNTIHIYLEVKKGDASR